MNKLPQGSVLGHEASSLPGDFAASVTREPALHELALRRRAASGARGRLQALNLSQ